MTSLGPDSELGQLLPHEVAAWIRVSVPTLARWRHQGTGPKYNKGPGKRSRITYPVAAVRDWLSQNTHSSTSDQGDR